MNKVILMGRLTSDPDVRYIAQGDNNMAIARYNLAVDRRFRRDGEAIADFIRCVAFGKQGEFAEKYLKKGTKIVIEGRLQTGSYTNKDNQKVFTVEVVIEHSEFAESKASADSRASSSQPMPDEDENGFMNIPEDDEDYPFN